MVQQCKTKVLKKLIEFYVGGIEIGDNSIGKVKVKSWLERPLRGRTTELPKKNCIFLPFLAFL